MKTIPLLFILCVPTLVAEPPPEGPVATPESLIRSLGDPDWQTREKAQNALAQRGSEVLPFLKKAYADEKDPERGERLRMLLALAAPIEAVVTFEHLTIKAGEKPTWSVRLVNRGEVPVTLSRALDGSDDSKRYPYAYFEVLDERGNPVKLSWPGIDDCDWLNAPAPGDWITVPPGEDMELYARHPGQSRGTKFECWTPEKPGTYRIRFVYDSSSEDLSDWTGHGGWDHLEAEASRNAEAAGKLRDIKSGFRRLRHVRTISSWISLTVAQ